MKRCSFCSEEIQDSAKKCRYCWEWLNIKTTSPELLNDTNVIGLSNWSKINKEQEKWDKLSGIWWWLIIPFLGLFYNIYNVINLIIENISSRDNIQEKYIYMIDLSILFNIIIWFLVVYSLILFFKRSKQLPKIYILFLIVNFIIAVLSAYIIESSWLIIAKSAYDPGQDIGRCLIGLIIWWLYFKRSIRVKNTFIN